MTLDELVSHFEVKGPPFDAASLVPVERSAGAKLPEDFVEFLQLSNGGEVRGDGEYLGTLFPRFPNDLCLRNRGYGHFVNGDKHQRRAEFCKSLVINFFFPAREKGDGYRVVTLYDLLEEHSFEPKNVPRNIIVFGMDGLGNLWAIDLSKPGGEVVTYNREQLPVSDAPEFPPYDGCFRLEMTFGQFVDALEVPPPEKPGYDTSGLINIKL